MRSIATAAAAALPLRSTPPRAELPSTPRPRPPHHGGSPRRPSPTADDDACPSPGLLRLGRTLCKILWKLETSGYNLRFTELTNRNTEIDRCVRDGAPYLEHLPKELQAEPPVLQPRIVPDPDNEDLGMELGGEGQVVWCQVEGRWYIGTVIGTKKRKVVVSVNDLGEDHDFEPGALTQFEPSHARDLPNMVMMQNLHEAPLLHLLQRRLKEGRIYTWAGDVLISLNPYARIPELYAIASFLKLDPQSSNPQAAEATPRKLVRRMSLSATPAKLTRAASSTDQATEAAAALRAKRKEAEAPPHVYSTARRAYTQLVIASAMDQFDAAEAAMDGVHVDQSVLISGESGAGKTEAAKRVLEYLTAASRSAKAEHGEAGGGGGAAMAGVSGGGGGGGEFGLLGGEEDMSIEFMLKEASPVLEAFGNAKTIRNDNSSRFGKYVAVQYGESGGIVGAVTETYLLERSRVVDVGPGERNYHIFYQMLTNSAICKQWGLGEASGYAYLSAEGAVATVEEMNDTREFASVQSALRTFRFSAEEVAAVWRMLASILLLGNVSFRPQAAGAGGDDGEVAEVVDEAALASAAGALGCEVEALRFPLLRKHIKVMRDTIVTHYTVKAAGQSRDALAKGAQWAAPLLSPPPPSSSVPLRPPRPSRLICCSPRPGALPLPLSLSLSLSLPLPLSLSLPLSFSLSLSHTHTHTCNPASSCPPTPAPSPTPTPRRSHLLDALRHDRGARERGVSRARRHALDRHPRHLRLRKPQGQLLRAALHQLRQRDAAGAVQRVGLHRRAAAAHAGGRRGGRRRARLLRHPAGPHDAPPHRFGRPVPIGRARLRRRVLPAD